MPLWIGETWLCARCEFVNAILRKRCRNCGQDAPAPPPDAELNVSSEINTDPRPLTYGPHECDSNSPPWFTGRWRDWHRGHGCRKDDGKPRSAEAVAEIAAHESSTA